MAYDRMAGARDYGSATTSQNAAYDNTLAPGKRTRTEGLSGRPRDPAAEAEHRLTVVEGSTEGLFEQLTQYQITLINREFHEARSLALNLEVRKRMLNEDLQTARNAVSIERASYSERSLLDQQTGTFNMVDPSMQRQLKLAQLEGRVTKLFVEIDEGLALRPPEAVSTQDSYGGMGFDLFQPYNPADPRWANYDLEQKIQQAQWEGRLDAYARQRGLEAAKRREQQPVRPEQECAIEGGISQHAVDGIHLALTFSGKLPVDETLPNTSVGPGEVEKYKLIPKSNQRMLVAFEAWHVERKQTEWIIGPRDINTFVANVDYYIGAARYALPGSNKLPDTKQDGTENVIANPSILEQQRTGDISFPLNTDGNPNGGSTLVGLHNMGVRLHEYIDEARRMADKLLVEVRGGTKDHKKARVAAVDGRNKMLQDARGKMSPAAKYTSRQLKGDQGVSLRAMEAKKVKDLLEHSRRSGGGMTEALGLEGDSRALQNRLAVDSPEWAVFGRQLDQLPNDGTFRSILPRNDVYKEAIRKLAAQPVVSEAIINSAGKNNMKVTAICRVEHAIAKGAIVIGAYEIASTIWNAEEGERFHVAAREFSGFAGGIVGAEAGAAGAVYLASLIFSSPGAVPLMIVSLVGGAIGATVGADVGLGVYESAVDTAGYGMMWMAGPGNPMGGGYAGMHEREQAGNDRERRMEDDVGYRLETTLFDMDQYLSGLGAKIQAAESLEELQGYQRERLALMAHRRGLEALYALYETGQITEEDVDRLLAGEPAISAEGES